MLPSVSQIWRGLALGLLASLLLPGLARAQWVSENYSAPLGYSAIWVGLDLSHTTIDEALAGKTTITEVWRWNPPSGPQFVTNPDTPVQSDTKWSVWKRGLPLESTLFQFTGNAAYLIRVGSGATVAFTLKGRPLRPEYNWNTTGVNLVGCHGFDRGHLYAISLLRCSLRHRSHGARLSRWCVEQRHAEKPPAHH